MIYKQVIHNNHRFIWQHDEAHSPDDWVDTSSIESMEMYHEERQKLETGEYLALSLHVFAPCVCNCPECDGWKAKTALHGFVTDGDPDQINAYEHAMIGLPYQEQIPA